MAGRRPTYRDHLSALATLGKGEAWPEGVRFVCLFGPSEYLLNHTIASLRQKAECSGALYTGIEATSVNEQLVACMGDQGSLFEPATFYVIRRVEQAKSLPKLLKGMQVGAGANIICFVYKGDSPAAPFKAELTRLAARLIPCFDPWPNEIAPVIHGMAAEKDLKLKPDAVALIIDAVGTDLVKLDHETTKLSLIYAGTSATVAAADIAPHLDMIREDDAYQLDRLLLQRQWAKAQTLINDLLQRGEKPTALLAIIAGHCRNALRITGALRQGARAQDLGPGLRLPQFLVKPYVQALVGADPMRYARALNACRQADLQIKSSRVADTLLMASVLDALMTESTAAR